MTRFGGGAGMGGGYGSGGGAGGTGMFRAVSRVARARLSNLQDHSSPSSSSSSSSANSPRNASKRGLTLSNNSLAAIASPSVSLSNSICGFGSARTLNSSSSLCDETEWIRVHDEVSVEDGNDSFDDFFFGSVPSPHEVTSALLSLQQALPTSSTSDWMEPSLHMYDQRIYSGIGRVFDALHLLQIDPSVQRMVISLSSDRAVWDAILNNEAVRELRESYYSDEGTNDSESSDDESNPQTSSTNLLSWIIDNMRSKLMEFLAGITNLIKEAFQAADNEQQTDGFPDGFSDKVRASFLLTAILLLIVVMSRASQA